MSEPSDGSAQGRELWRRWTMTARAAAARSSGDDSRPDELTLAEFAEGRLTGSARAAVEAFLAANPQIADDVAAARRVPTTGRATDDAALAVTIARAAALVAAPARGGAGGTVLAFRPARRPVSVWPIAARWAALAATLALTGWLGFAMGGDAYGNLAVLDRHSSTALADEVLDPPTGFFGLPDTSGT
jgi:nucleoid-associated protein YgaU